MTWEPGQRAVINRQHIVTIERVTPSGRAIVEKRTFECDGQERTNGSPYRRSKLEPLTSEISAEMELAERGKVATDAAYQALTDTDYWLQEIVSSWGRVPEAADVEKVERLVSAIREAMQTPNETR